MRLGEVGLLASVYRCQEMEIKMQNIRIYGILACNMASSGIEMGYYTPIEAKK